MYLCSKIFNLKDQIISILNMSEYMYICHADVHGLDDGYALASIDN